MKKTIIVLASLVFMLAAGSSRAATNYVVNAKDGTVLYVTAQQPIYNAAAGTLTIFATQVRVPDLQLKGYRLETADVTLGPVDWTAISMSSTTNSLPGAFTNVAQVSAVAATPANPTLAVTTLLLNEVNSLRARLGLAPETLDQVTAAAASGP